LLGSTARLNLPQFTADFPRFRMLPGNLTSSDQIPPARTNGKKRRDEGRSRPSVCYSLCFFRNAYVCKPRTDLQTSKLSPVLFNACLKLIKAGRTSLLVDPQSESQQRTTALSTPSVYACLFLLHFYVRDVILNRRTTDKEKAK